MRGTMGRVGEGALRAGNATESLVPQRPRHLLYPSYATMAVLLLALTLPVYHETYVPNYYMPDF